MKLKTKTYKVHVLIKPEMNLSNLKYSKDYMNINMKLDKQY